MLSQPFVAFLSQAWANWSKDAGLKHSSCFVSLPSYGSFSWDGSSTSGRSSTPLATEARAIATATPMRAHTTDKPACNARLLAVLSFQRLSAPARLGGHDCKSP